MDKKLKLKQVRSSANTRDAHIRVLKALGLGRRGKENTLNDTPAIRGMLRKVIQWLEVSYVEVK